MLCTGADTGDGLWCRLVQLFRTALPAFGEIPMLGQTSLADKTEMRSRHYITWYGSAFGSVLVVGRGVMMKDVEWRTTGNISRVWQEVQNWWDAACAPRPTASRITPNTLWA